MMPDRIVAPLEQVARAAEFITGAVIVADPSFTVVSQSRRARALYGFHDADIVGSSLLADFSFTPLDSGQPRREAAMTAGRGFTAEGRVRCADGTLRMVSMDTSPLTTDDGAIVGWMSVGHDIGDQRRDTATPPQAEQHFRSVFAAMAEGLVYQAADGRIIECNEAAERILGLTRGQMEGRTSIDPRWQAIHEDGSDFPGEAHPAMMVLRSGAPVRDVVMGVRRPDGNLVWILINAEPIRHSATAPPDAVVATFTDITAHKNAERRLETSEDRYRRLFENLREEVTVFDVRRDEHGQAVDWAFREANSAARQRRSELPLAPGTSMLEAYGDAFRPIIARTDEIVDGRAVARELYFAPLESWFQSTPFALDRDTIVAVALDITARRLAERRVQESEARLRIVVEHSDVAVSLVNARTGQLILSNRRQSELTGFTSEETQTMSLAEANARVHPEDRLAVENQMRRLLRGQNETDVVEFRWLTKNNGYRWFSGRRALVRDADGDGDGSAVVGFLQDITDQKQLDDALRAQLVANTSLVAQLRERLATKALPEQLSICMYCKKVRDDADQWLPLNEYVMRHRLSLFSHGMCPHCLEQVLAELDGPDEA